MSDDTFQEPLNLVIGHWWQSVSNVACPEVVDAATRSPGVHNDLADLVLVLVLQPPANEAPLCSILFALFTRFLHPVHDVCEVAPDLVWSQWHPVALRHDESQSSPSSTSRLKIVHDSCKSTTFALGLGQVVDTSRREPIAYSDSQGNCSKNPSYIRACCMRTSRLSRQKQACQPFFDSEFRRGSPGHIELPDCRSPRECEQQRTRVEETGRVRLKAATKAGSKGR